MGYMTKVYTSPVEVTDELENAGLEMEHNDKGHVYFTDEDGSIKFSARFVATFTAYVDLIRAYRAGLAEGERRKAVELKARLNI